MFFSLDERRGREVHGLVSPARSESRVALPQLETET
jgi:hypothetical protein